MNNRVPFFSQRLQGMLRTLVALGQFFHPAAGVEYGVSLPSKIILLLKIIRSKRRVGGSNDTIELLAMATALMNVPRVVEGCAVECGCSQGRSAVVLSLVCALCNRRLELFPGKDKGSAALAELRASITRYGDITSCHFNVGHLEQAMPRFKLWCVFVLLDVELPTLLDSCLRYFWPLLQNRCPLVIPQARRVAFDERFADNGWWQSNLQAAAPGLAGVQSGSGYALKFRSI